jgi:wobble nucleotide-excising tRNase
MGVLEEMKVVQIINRMESARELLDAVNAADSRFNEKIAPMNQKLAGFEKELAEIKTQLNVENLGVKSNNS